MGSDLEEVVDIKSGIAYLLVKWKLIVLIALICAAVGAGYASVKKSQQKTGVVVSYEDKLKKARGALQEADALYVEQLSNQYKNYGKRLNNWYLYMQQSALQNTDPYNYSKRDIQYTVVSDNGSTINAFSASLLGQEEYEKIAQLMNCDVQTASLQELFTVTNTSLVGAESAKGDDGDDITQEIVSAGSESFSGIMNITFISPKEEAAEGVQEVIDEAISEKCSEMLSAGTFITVEKIDMTMSRNDAKWLLNQQQPAQQQIINLQTNRSNFVKNSVDTLPEALRSYFDLLSAGEEQKDAAAAASSGKKISRKKYALAGGLAGLILALIAVYLSFVFSDRIRSEEELRDNFKLPVLQRFRIGKAPSGVDVIRNAGLSMLGAAKASETTESGAALLSAELERRIPGKEKSRLYIAYDCDTQSVKSAMDALAKQLSGESLTAAAGNPGASDAEGRELLKCDAVVIAETLNVSGKKMLRNLTEVCKRNGIPILGCVTLFDAAKY